MAAVRVPVRQGSQAWLDYRKTVITGTMLPVILGLSPWRCEADLADELLGSAEPQESSVRMRMGSALEPFVLAEYELATGRRTQRFRGMVRHPEIEWAAASPDARVIGEKRLVEVKTTASRTRFADGVPDDVAAQVAWQLGCSGYPVADVAVLAGDALSVHEVAFDAALFADLVSVAADFRRRLAEGGPFARDLARIRRDHPADDGSEVAADNDTAEAMRALLDVRAAIKGHEASEEALVRAICDRMGDAALMTAPGMRATWRRSKDRSETDWKALGAEITQAMPESERAALVGRHSSVRQGMRPFRLTADKEE